jgi:hypothetical protein
MECRQCPGQALHASTLANFGALAILGFNGERQSFAVSLGLHKTSVQVHVHLFVLLSSSGIAHLPINHSVDTFSDFVDSCLFQTSRKSNNYIKSPYELNL